MALYRNVNIIDDSLTDGIKIITRAMTTNIWSVKVSRGCQIADLDHDLLHINMVRSPINVDWWPKRTDVVMTGLRRKT